MRSLQCHELEKVVEPGTINLMVVVEALTSCITALANVPFSFSFQSGQNGVPEA